MKIKRVDKDTIELAIQSAELFCWNNPAETINEDFFSSENNVLIVAVEDDKVVGSIYGYVLERYDTRLKQLFIYSIDIIDGYRQQGIAKLLMNEFLKDINSGNYHNAFVITNEDNIPAMKLYESVGGKRIVADDGIEAMFKWQAEV